MDRAFAQNGSNFTFTTSPSTKNYFSDQALRVGLAANELRRSELMVNSSHPLSRELIEREFEKEKIREEIIASEIIRRRELEAEVRSELAIERELVLRSPWSAPRLPMFGVTLPFSVRTDVGPFDGLPFQRRPEAAMMADSRLSMLDRGSSGLGIIERVPFSARTEAGPCDRLPFQRNPEAAMMADRYGVKERLASSAITEVGPYDRQRNSEASMMAESRLAMLDQPNGFGIRERVPSSAITDRLPFQRSPEAAKIAESSKADSLPFQRNPEAAKLSEMNKGQAGKIKLLAKPMTANLAGTKRKRTADSANRKIINPELKKRFAIWCETCQIGVHSEKVMNKHRKGKKHIMRMEEQKQTRSTASST